jgi:CRP/FNR family transcriptional regulator, cyclic AMP receptor protein
MLSRRALGLVPGNQVRRAISSRNGMPPKKPCHSVSGRVSLSSRNLRPVAVWKQASPPTVKADPLFLLICGVQWHRFAEPAAGWELIQAMLSEDRGARAFAAELLARTEDGRLLVRDLRRTRSGLHQLTRTTETPIQPEVVRGEAAPMNTPYGLQMVENCLTCPLRQKSWYCGLSPDLLKAFNEFSHLTTYPGGAVLFVEGQMPRGAFVLCSGKVKISTTSKEGKVLVLKVVEPGEVMGLSAMISGEAYEVTAETMGPSLVNFVEQEGLLRLMETSGELGMRSAQAVSREFQFTYREIHELVLSRSSSGKLARLLLSWVGRDAGKDSEFRIHAPATHEEMAQRIGASRETVTRLLSELRKKDLIRLDGTTLVIKNRPALEALAV